MTKRDLVKWLQEKKEEASNKAKLATEDKINQRLEAIYEEIGLDEYVDNIMNHMSLVEKEVQKMVAKVDNHEGSKYSMAWSSLRNLSDSYTGSRYSVKSLIISDLYIRDELKEQIASEGRKLRANVLNTYDVAIQTVKNLPSAKEGMEYLTNLGFDTKEIRPVNKDSEMQLPATVNVNVDTKYLLIDTK